MIKFANVKFNNQAGLLEIANIAAGFYGLDIHVDEADFSPNQNRADLKVITPNGRVVVMLHMSIYKGEKHWSIGGQTFVTSEQSSELQQLVKAKRMEENK